MTCILSRPSSACLAAAAALAAASAMWPAPAAAQASGGFQVIEPRASAAPVAIPRAGGAASGFQVLGVANPASQQPSAPARVAVAARPVQIPPPASVPISPKQQTPAATAAPVPPVPPAPPVVERPPEAVPSPAPAQEPPKEPSPATEAATIQQPAAEPVSTPVDPPAPVRDTADENVKQVDADHPLMKAARQRAQDGLDEFLSIASKPPPGARGFMLKVALKADGQTENIWVGALERRVRKKFFITTSESFSGRLGNEPVIVKGRKMGDRVSFSRSDIRDWMYQTPEGRMAGNASACAIAAANGQAMVEKLSRQYGLDCGWLNATTASVK
ncbi:MAG: DUF2314 domain-containing protein [Beijerinckiaceae bacterium]